MSDESSKNVDPGSVTYVYQDNERDVEEATVFSLDPLIRTSRTYRNVLLLAALAIIFIVVVALLLAYSRQSTDVRATLGFRLEFEGIDRRAYPNGTKFSAADIISTPVLTEVFDHSDLKRFMSYDVFKSAIFILESNPELQRVSRDYESKLSNPRLTTVERERLETEFQNKRQTLQQSEYSLNFSRKETTEAVPPALIHRTLNSILVTWADNASRRKGALSYQIPVFSRNIIQKEFLDAQDQLIALDILRSKIADILSNIGEVSSLPGANVIRTGPRKLSLPEVKASLEDLLRFSLEPIVTTIQASGASNNPKSVVLYLEARLSQINQRRETTAGRTQVLKEALRNYVQQHQGSIVEPDARGTKDQRVGVNPQFTDAFLDRLVNLSTENIDVKFRQDITERIVKEGLTGVSLDVEASYYQRMLDIVRRLARNPVEEQRIRESSSKVLDAILVALDQVNAIYTEISAQNLNPSSTLYIITAPASVITEHSLRFIPTLLYASAMALVAFVLVFLGCLVHARIRQPLRPRADAGRKSRVPRMPHEISATVDE